MDLLFDLETERTEFSDAAYAAAGRALAYVQSFECDCRALNTLLNLREAVSTGELSLSDAASVEQFASKLYKAVLHHHLSEIVQYYEAPELAFLFERARQSRNLIAHDLLVGVQHDIETDVGRDRLAQAVVGAIEHVARAHLLVLALMSRETHEPLPSARYLAGYVSRVTGWVSLDGDE